MIRNRPSKYQSSPHKRAAWLTTFNDLVTLMLVFFVLLFIMSSIDVKKLYKASMSLRSGLGILEAGQTTKVDTLRRFETGHNVETEEPDTESNQDEEIEASVRELDSEPGIDMLRTREGITITMEDHILFRSGKAAIDNDGYPVLDSIVAKVLKRISGPVRVEGHTDNVPVVYNQRYPTNWELSIARAVNVVKYFIEAGDIDPERLSAVGYGELKPLVPNTSPENRAKNRRVEIKLVTKGINET